jgi:hypothetical protein
MRITMFLRAAPLCLACAVSVTAASAQVPTTVRVTAHTVVMDSPRGDGHVLGTIEAGTVLKVVRAGESWFEVDAPETLQAPWQRGWIHSQYLEATGTVPTRRRASDPFGAQPKPPGRTMVRGFGQAGGTLFLAKDSFQTILDRASGVTYGLGGQLNLASGLMAQVGADRYKKIGNRAIVSGGQVFRLGTPDNVSVTTFQATIGYRDATSRRVAGYVGGGGGWLAFKEDSPSLAGQSVDAGHIEYHVIGGGEFLILPGLWGGGEVQWRTVPKGLGSTGIGAFFNESNLGGTTFLFKVLVGR